MNGVHRRLATACWRGRPIEVAAASWTTLVAALPSIAISRLENAAGGRHPLEHWAEVRWPVGGSLTDDDRADWSHSPIGMCGSGTEIIQPKGLATSLRGDLRATAGDRRREEHWELESSWLGEWLRLRASWAAPGAGESGDRPEEWIGTTLRAGAGSAELTTGWRLRNGAEMIGYREQVTTGPRKLSGCVTGDRSVATAIARLQTGTERMSGWGETRVEPAALAEWTRERATLWHPQVLAGLVRGVTSGNVKSDLRSIAWRLAGMLETTRDIDTRLEQQFELRDQIGDLETWSDEPFDLLGAFGNVQAGSGTVH